MSSSPSSDVAAVDGDELLLPLPGWLVPAGATTLLAGAIGAGLWVAEHLHPDHALHEVAVFLHLASLVLGFGAVLAVDWVALLWAARRRTLADVLRTAGNAHVPAWLGYGGLVLSGVLLEPDLAAWTTRVKLAMVVLIGWNGVAAVGIQRRLSAVRGTLVPRNLLLAAAGSAAVSQAGWWGAMLLGFLNRR